MAFLPDKWDNISLVIQPVMPSLEGPHNAYDVVLRQKQECLFERQYTTFAESQDGHWYVWRLFRAFQLAERMASKKTTLNITGRRDKHGNEPATLSVDVGWLHAIFSSHTITHRYNQPEPSTEARSQVDLYLLTDPQELGQVFYGCRHFIQFSLICRPKDVVEFGKALEIECREALRLRRDLGITALADDYIDD